MTLAAIAAVERKARTLFTCLNYSFANETLSSVIAGLTPDQEDNFLVVGGSGDQAFALAEHAGRVIVCDINPFQVDFIKKRLKPLKRGDLNEFLFIPGTRGMHDNEWTGYRQKRDRYFTRDRFERIRDNIDNIEVLEPVDITEAASYINVWNKLYLSNLFGWKGQVCDCDVLIESLSRFSKNTPTGGLVYLSSTRTVNGLDTLGSGTLNATNLEPRLTEEAREKILHSGFYVDAERTYNARKLETANWTPLVLVKD